METTVTANFEHPSAAEDAASALVDAGIPQSSVLVFPGDSEEVLRARRLASPNHIHRALVPPDVGAAMGFTAGFLGGGFGGLLLGSGVLNIMGKQAAMSVGPFWAAVIGALALGLAGALAGHIFNAPLPALDPAHDVGPRPRFTVVAVTVPEERAQEAVAAIDAKRPRDVRIWRSGEGGWVPA